MATTLELIIEKYDLHLHKNLCNNIDDGLEKQIMTFIKTVSLTLNNNYPEKVYECTIDDIQKCINYNESINANDIIQILSKNNIYSNTYCGVCWWHMNINNDELVYQE